MRFEILPFPSAEEEADQAPGPLTLTVTCSPRHGVDHSLEVGGRLRAAGHRVVVHVAARMVHGPGHLDELLARMEELDIADVFLIGGDSPEAEGPYASALDLLPELRARPLRSIGVAAYPEGHPFIDDAVLADALREKDGVADYMTTQLCFDAEALRRWLIDTRAAGIALPVHIGLPGIVDARRLLEVSMRIGVGASLRFARKQRGVARMFGGAERLQTEVLPLRDDPGLGVTDLHYFTFNRLLDTVRLAEAAALPRRSVAT